MEPRIGDLVETKSGAIGYVLSSNDVRNDKSFVQTKDEMFTLEITVKWMGNNEDCMYPFTRGYHFLICDWSSFLGANQWKWFPRKG